MISKEFIIENALLWRADNDALDQLSSPLHVRDGRIVAIGGSVPADVPTLSLPGRVIVPGLIDAHVHLELDPELRTPAEQMGVPEVDRRRAMRGRAAAMLAAGITTARDCGGGAYMEHHLREQIATGQAVGPRLLCCGQPITTPGGHCGFWGGEVTGHSDIAPTIERQIDAKSDWIKVMATGGVFTPGSRARDAQFDLDSMREVVARAGDAGRFVAAHCHGTEGIANSVHAGVRTIEHASFAGPDGFGTALDAALMDEMAAATLWVSPTVNAGWGRRIVNDEGSETNFFKRLSGCLQQQKSHGIRFIASTDAGIPGVFHHDLVAGLCAFERFAELRPVDVLRSATSEAATALGIADEAGAIEVGRSADLLVLDGNPLEDLSLLGDPEIVIAKGQPFDRAERSRWRADLT